MAWIWNDPAFVELCCDDFFSFNAGSVIPIANLSSTSCLNNAVKLMLRIINKALEKSGSLISPQMYKSLLKAKEVMSTTDSALWQHLQDAVTAAAGGNFGMIYRFIFGLLARIRDLPADSWVIIPGGILLSEETPVEWILYAVHKPPNSANYVFAVINTGTLGLKYHSFRVDKNINVGMLQRDATIVLKDVSSDRLIHSAFWFLLYRLMFAPSIHNYETLYTVLLPFLNSKPVLLNWRIEVDPPKSSSTANGKANGASGVGGTTKKLLIDTFTKLKESHDALHSKTDCTRNLVLELSRNVGGVWTDVPLNDYKPTSMTRLIVIFTELLLRQDEHSDHDVRIVKIIFQTSLCLLLDQELDALAPQDYAVQLGKRSVSLFVEVTCKRLCIMVAEESLHGALKDDLIDFTNDADSASLETATKLSQVVGSMNSAFPSVAKVAGCLGQEQEALVYDAGAPLGTIGDLYNLIATLVGKIYTSLQGRLPPHALGMGPGSCTIEKQLCSAKTQCHINCEFDHFGKFRLDGPNVNELAKGSVVAQLVLPVEFTSVDLPIENCSDVVKVLRRCIEVCTLLSNQRDSIQYTYAWRFQLIKHVLFEIIPLPLPLGSEHESQCFWVSNEIERETQIDLLRLLQMLARHVAVVFLSLVRTRVIEGEKAIMLAAICAITDAVVRKSAKTTPSKVSLLYAGKADGPTSAFGFTLGNFASETSYYSLTCPLAVIARTQILDYFESVTKDLDVHHTIFNWENNMEISPADDLLVHLIALQFGFYRNPEDIRKYYIGDCCEFTSIFPEFGYFRDVVFIAKSLGWSGTFNTSSRYSLADSLLKWSLPNTGSKPCIAVKAFGKALKVAGLGKVRGVDETNATYYKRMVRWFGGSTSQKTPSSAADPHNLATEAEIENETDVLHLSTLPDYGGKLGRRDSELLLQYLTACYIRIPLVTQFFADEANLHAVSSHELQKVVTACVFEPGLWQSGLGGTARAQTAPVQSPECLSTPLGLLFNEIYHSGSSVLASIEKMLELALERDNCVFAGTSSLVLPFAVRLSTNVCNYVHKAIVYYRSNLHEPNNTNLIVNTTATAPVARNYKNKMVRGLLLQNESACNDLEVFQRRMRRLLLEAAKALEKRAIKAARVNEQNAASTAMAHVALVYRFILQIDVIDAPEPPANTDSIVLSLTCALFFVHVHHQFTVEHQMDCPPNENLFEVDKEDEEPLSMPEIELFGYMQSVRTYLLDYLRGKGKEACSGILERLVQRVSQLGMSQDEIASVELHERPGIGGDDFWQELQMPINSGRFSRSSWVQRQMKSTHLLHLDDENADVSDFEDDVLMESYYVDDDVERSVAEEIGQAGWGFDSQTATGIEPEILQQEQEQQKEQEQFLKKQKYENKGLISSTKHVVMDQTKKTFDKSKTLGKRVYRKLRRHKKSQQSTTPIEVYEDWLKMQAMQHCDIEINFQTVEFSLKKNKLQLLGPWANQFAHFVKLMGPVSSKSTVQSVTVQLHRNRHWLKLVGRRYSLIRWEPDDRDYLPPPKTLYRHATCPKPLKWLPPILEPWLKQHMPEWSIYINKADVDASVNQASAYSEHDDYYQMQDGDDYFKRGGKLDTVRLYAQYYVSAHHTGEPKKQVDVPVADFAQSPYSGIRDATVDYVPHEPDGLTKFAKNATETLTNISNVITDAAHTISKMSNKGKSPKSEKIEKEPETAVCLPASSSGNAGGTRRCVTKELIVTRDPPCIFVYDLVQQGRTWYRALTYCSDATRSYSNSLPRYVTLQNVAQGKPGLVVGKPAQPSPATETTTTLLVIRSMLNEGGVSTKEQYVLDVCLRGLLPEVLLEEYDFWQNIKTSDILGYPKSSSCERYAKTRLHIELQPQGPPDSTLFQHSDSAAIVCRKPLGTIDPNADQFLVNLQNPQDLLVQSLVRTLLRLDDLSHILAWSDVTKRRIELVEFAKLGLTFKAVLAANKSVVRYMCEEHNGLFLNYGDIWQSPLTAALIRGLENTCLLTDDDGELYILVSTVRCPIRVFPHIPNNAIVGQEVANVLQGIAWPELIYDGANTEWLQAIDTGSRHYLYKVHSSRSFLFVPTYAASLYLLLNRFLDRQYEQVCRLSRTTLFDDGSVNNEERVFWEVLARIDSTRDLHPDAYACRLHLLLAANRQGLHIAEGIKMKHSRRFHRAIQRNLTNIKCVFTGVKRSTKREQDDTSLVKWLLHEQLLGYITSLRFVSAGCRLSLDDEKELLRLCQAQFGKFPILNNRFTLLQAITRSSTRGYCLSHAVEFGIPMKPSVHNYDDLVDKSAIEKNLLVDSAASAFTNIRFKRPDSTLSGPVALQYVDKLFQRGFGLGDSLVVYELLTGNFPFNVVPNESSHGWGALLTRYICHKEPSTKSIILSTLKLLSRDPSLGSNMPKVPDDVTQTKKFSLLHLASTKQPIHKFMGEIQKAVCELNEQKRLEWTDSSRSSHRSEYALRVDAAVGAGKTLVPWSFAHYEMQCSRTSMDITPCTVGTAQITPEFIKSQSSGIFNEVIDDSLVTKVTEPSQKQSLALNLGQHWIQRFAPARRILKRLEADYDYYLKDELEKHRKEQFIGFSEEQLDEMAKDPQKLAAGLMRLQTLRERLLALFKSDGQFVENGIRCALRRANSVAPKCVDAASGQRLKCWGYIFGKLAGIESLIGLDQLVECLVDAAGDDNLRLLNPFVEDAHQILQLVAAVMFAVNRRTLIARGISQLVAALQSLKRYATPNLSEESRLALRADVYTSTNILSERVNAARHYMTLHAQTLGAASASDNNNTDGKLVAKFDPRLLLFEFSSNILLHKRQVDLVEGFVNAANRGASSCHQLIMGEGKTTVVGPLLSVLLADGKRLFVQVCPQALLEFTRATLRETFSAVIHKSVFTLRFSRFDRATPELYLKLLQAKQTRSVVICTPTSIKSIFLRVIHCFHKLDAGVLDEGDTFERLNNIQQRLSRIWNMTGTNTNKLIQQASNSSSKSSKQRSSSQDSSAANADINQRSIQLELDMCLRLLELFSNAILLMDEIDLLMHPLKSELHWPIGEKKPLAHLRNSNFCIRWLLPWHMLRVMLPQTQYQVSKSETHLVNRIRAVLAEGVAGCNVADSPHLTLLNIHWYNGELKPLMAEWVHFFLRSNNLVVEPYEQILKFLITGEPNQTLSSIEVLNFCKEWLWSTFPHVIQKVNLVNYGVLNMKQVEETMQTNPNVPQTRKMLAVPFVGKGTPSRDSEFSHPDVLIGFTILAYKYQGLRMTDFVLALRHLAQQFYNEPGRPHDRKSFKIFNRWVTSAGARLRDTARTASSQYHYLYETCDSDNEKGSPNQGSTCLSPASSASSSSSDVDDDGASSVSAAAGSVATAASVDKSREIWTLDAINVYDDDQIQVLYDLLKMDGLVIEYYLCNVLFPVAMEHTGLQLTASAHELGSSILFPIRLGFSGTPSQLLPAEMGGCHYSRGTDGKILNILTDASIVKGPTVLSKGWTSESILNLVATSPLKPLALIDTGALITNLSNLQVARELLTRGLNHVDGVVYLDDQDRQMILLRDRWHTSLLSHCGIPLERRFCFYDQVHATGQDIKQAAHALAFITIGADMTFRDYSQGAWRMRGIGRGQRLHLIIPREVQTLITSDQPHEPCRIKQTLQWLLVRGISAEIRNWRILLEQSIMNVIRKQSFQTLIEDHLNISSSNSNLGRCVQIFREVKDFSIPNSFAKRRTIVDKLRFLIRTHNIPDSSLQLFLKISMSPMTLADLKLGTGSGTSGIVNVPGGVGGGGITLNSVLAAASGIHNPNANVKSPRTYKSSELTNNNMLDIFATHADEDIAADSDVDDDASTADYQDKFKRDERQLNYLEMEQNLSPDSFEYEAEHEQEMEWQQEQQEQEEEATHLRQQTKEEEHATEEEAPAPHRYSRSEEDIIYWSLDKLAHDPSATDAFLPCREFYLYRKDNSRLCMPFPEYICISPNFYKLRWSANSYRRLKNIIVVLDVSFGDGVATQETANLPVSGWQQPILAQGAGGADSSSTITSPFVTPQSNIMSNSYSNNYGVNNVNGDPGSAIPKHIIRRVARAFDILASENGTISKSVALCVINAIGLEDSRDAELIASVLSRTLEFDALDCINQSKFLVGMQRLFTVDPARKFIIVTLAEAEAIRAWLHDRLGHLNVKLALRHLAARFQPFDTSRTFAPTRHDKIAALVGLQPRIAHACLKFLNSEFHYTAGQILLLQECLHQVSVHERLAFFQHLCEMRLVVQNIKAVLQSAQQLPRLFQAPTVDALVIQLLNIKLQKIASERGGPQGLLQMLNVSRLNAKTLGNILNTGPRGVAQPAEISGLLDYLDQDKDGAVGLEDLEASFEEHGDVTNLYGQVAGANFALVPHEHVRRVASCQHFSAWAPKQLGQQVQSRVLFYPLTHAIYTNATSPVVVYVIKTSLRPHLLDMVLVKPLKFRQVWMDDVQDPKCVLWKPTAPPGHAPLGLVATTSVNEEPPLFSTVCPPEKWLKTVTNGAEYILVDGYDPQGKECRLKLACYKGFANVDEAVALKSDRFQISGFSSTTLPDMRL